jgi:hypothetical protein
MDYETGFWFFLSDGDDSGGACFAAAPFSIVEVTGRILQHTGSNFV